MTDDRIKLTEKKKKKLPIKVVPYDDLPQEQKDYYEMFKVTDPIDFSYYPEEPRRKHQKRMKAKRKCSCK